MELMEVDPGGRVASCAKSLRSPSADGIMVKMFI
jgi:hypothetical protein